MATTPAPSRSQIRKSAKLLREWWNDPDAAATDNVAIAWAAMSDYRATFQRPLDKVTIQLRRFVDRQTPHERVFVAQRLKRMPTILDKLGRQPTMDITRMQDIGGCRAVLLGQGDVNDVAEAIHGHWDVRWYRNYVEEPKSTGYRAVHIAVMRDDRLIEIQLRTTGQHDWAVAVESVGSRLRASVKDGVGPPAVLRYFELAGQGIALAERGETPDSAFTDEFEALNQQVRAILGRSH